MSYVKKSVKKRHAQEMTEANCITRLSRAKKLLNKFPENSVDFILFTDEKVFAVAPPVDLQNDRVYAPCGAKKLDIVADRLLRTPTLADVQQVCHGVCHGLKTWMH